MLKSAFAIQIQSSINKHHDEGKDMPLLLHLILCSIGPFVETGAAFCEEDALCVEPQSARFMFQGARPATNMTFTVCLNSRSVLCFICQKEVQRGHKMVSFFKALTALMPSCQSYSLRHYITLHCFVSCLFKIYITLIKNLYGNVFRLSIANIVVKPNNIIKKIIIIMVYFSFYCCCILVEIMHFAANRSSVMMDVWHYKMFIKSRHFLCIIHFPRVIDSLWNQLVNRRLWTGWMLKYELSLACMLQFMWILYDCFV